MHATPKLPLTGRQLGGDGGAEAELQAAGILCAQGAAVVVALAAGGAERLADLPGGGLGLGLGLGRQLSAGLGQLAVEDGGGQELGHHGGEAPAWGGRSRV